MTGSNGKSGDEKGGFKPLNDGYTAVEKRGFAGASTNQELPKAPTGGTGQTALNASTPAPSSAKKES